MTALLSPKFWIAIAIAAALAFSHFFVYRAGKAQVRTAWDEQKLVDAETARRAIEANRAKEQALQATLTKAKDDATKRENTLRTAAAGARSERDRLRDAITATTSGIVPGDPPGTILARAATLGGLLDQCAARYTEMAEHASGHASDALMLKEGWPVQ